MHTKLTVVTQHWILSHRIKFCDTGLDFISQNWISWHRIDFCDTELTFATQNWTRLLSHKIIFCDTKFILITKRSSPIRRPVNGHWITYFTLSFYVLYIISPFSPSVLPLILFLSILLTYYLIWRKILITNFDFFFSN